MPELSPEHAEFLRSQAVDVELAKSKGVFSVMDRAELADVPDGELWFKNWTHAPYIAFPWTGPNGRTEWQIRPDVAPLDSNGKPKKYVFRSKKMGYEPVLWAVRPITETTTLALIVEGTKQCLAAASYAPAHVAVFGIGGCRMWSSEGMPVPDIAAVGDGREVVILLDADAGTNPQVFDAGTNLKEALLQEGATGVGFARITGAGEKDGLDDVLAARPEERRADWLARLIESGRKNAKPAASRPKGAGKPPPGVEILPEPSDPLAVARVIEPELKAEGGAYTLRNFRDGWWEWRTSHWAETEKLAVKGRLYARTENARYALETKNGTSYERWKPNPVKVSGLAEALSTLVHLDRETRTPSWIWGDRGDLGTIVSCANGLLKLDGRELLAHDAGYFNLVAVPFDYDPDAEEPKEWIKFLETVWPDGGAGQVDALQEWFGYVISGRTDFQKIFAIIGPPRSGKGTIASVLTELAGAANVAGPTLASLAQNFGMQPLLGKSLALISDARIGRTTDTSIIVERLLTISGEDVLTVDRKHISPWEGRIPARIMLLSNELPRFSDGSGTIATRFVVTETVTSFLGREDRTLKARLMAELPGILNWALEGLDRLLARGHFTDTEVSTDAVDVMRTTASPMAPFVEDECVTGPEYEVAVDDLWEAWEFWCRQNGREHTGTKPWLGRDIKAVVPGVRQVQPRRPDGTRYRAYRGIGLRSNHPELMVGDAVGMEESSGTRRHAHQPIARDGENTSSKEEEKKNVLNKSSNGLVRVPTRAQRSTMPARCPYHHEPQSYCGVCNP